ncbi:hypothetical protein ACUJ46_10345 [Sandaracinobacteroides sp. A072]|uniref:hypothetical protein n=1 Tax=Sandaracinobacteroides sp. A072 TaxID=3461146 RepID=UPI0040419404
MQQMPELRSETALRRARNARAALDRLIENQPEQARMHMDETMRTASAANPDIGLRQARIAAQRNHLEQRASVFGIFAGALTLGLLLLLFLQEAAPAVLATRLLVAGLVLGVIRIAMLPGSKLATTQMIATAALSLYLLGPEANAVSSGIGTWDLAILLPCWGALVFRWLQMQDARAIDFDEADLLLDARGLGTMREQIRRKQRAII